MIAKIRLFLRTYPYVLFTAYPIIHVVAFFLMGLGEPRHYIISSPLDAYIPFCEWFVIPYYLWFLYLFGGMIAFLFVSRRDFLRMVIYTMGGLAICMVICAVFPTAIDFRPTAFERENLFTWLVGIIYAADKPWNVFPSMHCFGAIGITVAVWKAEDFRRMRWLRTASLVLCVLICLSTVLIKQHSIIDMIGALVLAVLLYPLAYCIRWKFLDGRDLAVPVRTKYRLFVSSRRTDPKKNKRSQVKL